jgi:uncharacterized protein
MKYQWIGVMALLAWLTGCKSGEKVQYAPNQIVPTERSLLWKISGNGLKKSSFLYGTIHLIPKEEFVLTEATRTAFDGSKRVAFEIDMKEMTNIRTQLGLMTKAFMAGGKTLKDLLSPEDYGLVRGKMDEKGLPSGMFERMKPMFLSMMFSSDEGAGASPMGSTSSMTSVEMELFRMSKRRNIESAGLESASYQMSIFDSIPYTAQAKMLVESLRSTEKKGDGKSELDQMMELYRAQDIVAMQHMVTDEDNGLANYEDVLLNRRNQNWIPVMGRMMREKPTFFAVGAGHLGGPNGVVALLRKAGYRVEVGK